MRLKSVRIFGFKTFADPTEFSLQGGIVAVVGPNGCGKSNLVDAILWGLGEANSRHLRATTNQEVIFSGSSRRKGVGYCEVTLLFDNEDGSLPLLSPEVALTRRLSRSGESDYSINRRPCRQRDVFELLADSGLGRTGYAIIGQKQIDAALSASSEERRSWIDEAAGVQRYRQRKQEAFRKLDSAREHLQRVADIVRELDSQRAPLREQAEQAAEYRRVQRSLRETEVGYLSFEAAEAKTEQIRFREQIEVASKLVRSEEFRAEALEAKGAELGSEIAEIERKVEAERQSERSEEAVVAKAQADIRLYTAKLEALSDQESSFEAERELVAKRIAEAEGELERCQEEYRAEQERAAEIRAVRSGSAEEISRLGMALEEAEGRLRQAAQQEAQRAKRVETREQLLGQRALAMRELESLMATFNDFKANVETARGQVAECSAQLESFRAHGKQLVTQEVALKALEEQEALAVRSALAERAALEGRERGIEETISSHEGISQGSRAVLEATAQGALSGEFVAVGEVIQTKPEQALAIETALGGAVNDLIVTRESDAKRAVEYLKQHRAGRATFQPISLMRPSEPGREVQTILSRPGVIGLADKIVECEDGYRPVIQSLLGRCLIVRDLDTALSIAGQRGPQDRSGGGRGWSKIATLDGELVHSSGSVTGGASARQSYGILQRKADLGRIRKQIDALSAQVDGFHNGSHERQREVSRLQTELGKTREKIGEQEEALAEAKSFLRTVEEEFRSAQRDLERLEREVAKEIPAAEGPPLPVHEFEQARDLALKALAAQSADADSSEARLREAERLLERSRQRVEAAIRRREQELQAERSREKRQESLVPDRERYLQLIETEAKRVGDHGLKAEAARQSMSFLKALSQQKAAEREAELAGANVSRQSAQVAREMLHQAELNRTRAEAKRFGALSKLAEEYSISESDLAGLSCAVPPPDAATLVARLRRELRAMGDVNMGAIEAYERLSTRLDELHGQKEDILGAIQEVENSVQELDRLTRDRFTTTFTAVQERFAQTFGRLFEGGVGTVELTHPDDILNSGIEIRVVLPGKKRQPLSLLSGGEQSLCTTAFLFSLLKVKPSPLVVLDEVDAPLDGRNVERYAELLKELSEEMQFIVITHNPVTIEMADTWLGVTMQEPGVSNLVPASAPRGS